MPVSLPVTNEVYVFLWGRLGVRILLLNLCLNLQVLFCYQFILYLGDLINTNVYWTYIVFLRIVCYSLVFLDLYFYMFITFGRKLRILYVPPFCDFITDTNQLCYHILLKRVKGHRTCTKFYTKVTKIIKICRKFITLPS